MIRLIYRINAKILHLYSQVFSKDVDFLKFENQYFNTAKKIFKRSSFEIGSHTLIYDLNSDVTKRLFLYKDFEKFEINKCLETIKSDSVVLDVGANIGLHTIYFSQKAVNGVVLTFEPSRKTFQILVNNTYQLKNVINFNFAISEKIGVADFYVSEDDAYSSLKDTKRKKIVGIEKVITYDLDNFILNLNFSNIDLIKIDVEGYEFEVLQGMKKVIEQYKPVIFIEIYKGINSNYDPNATIDFILGKGYKAFVCKNEKLVPFETHNDEFHNYFFYPSGNK